MSLDQPYAGILCRLHGNVDIDQANYDAQMARPNSLWRCPKCGMDCDFDDERFEELHPEINEE